MRPARLFGEFAFLGARERAATNARSIESSRASAAVHHASNSEEVTMTSAVSNMYIL
jgi:hypothetical protein